MAATALVLCPHTTQADPLPTGGNITAGLGNISQNGAVMTVQQNTSKMIVDWKGFSIGTDHTVNFVQPSSSSVALNRVTGADPSVIQGHLNANGQIFLINPNGVLFTPTAQVNVGGIVASTLALSDADFLAANYKFEGASSNAIINQGNLVAGKDSTGGNIVMIAAKITNDGTIDANGGAVVLGAGSKVTLDLGGPVKLSIESGALEALIQNGGAIRSDGGTILLTAQAADALSRTVIKNTGVVEAQTLSTGPNGEIILKGGTTDRIEVGGTLDASAPNGGDGGFVETSAGQIDFANDLRVTTAAAQGHIGKWLIDPDVIEIISGTPGTVIGTTYIAATVLDANLSTTDINLEATRWIDFKTNFNYTGSRAAILSLYAPVIELGGNISTATAKLSLNFGGTFNSSFYNGNLYVYGGSRSIATKGGDVNFYGNIGGSTTNSLSIDTAAGAVTPGAISHLATVNGTFNVTTVTTQLLNLGFTAGNKSSVLLDCTTGTLTVDGVITTPTAGSVPLGHINFPAGTVVSLNASSSGGDTVTITQLGGGVITITPLANGNITIPAGGLEITKIAYSTKSANAQNLGSNNSVDIYNTFNAAALANYTAVGGEFTINPSTYINVAGDIRVSTNHFLNNANASALVAGSGKTWQVWSSNTDPFNGSTGDVRGGLVYNFKQYNATYGTTTVLGAGNGFFYTYAPIISFTIVNDLTKVYDASNAATGLTGHYNASGAVDGDTIGESGGTPLPTTGTYASHNVGTGINVSVTGISAASILAYHTALSTPVYGYGLQSTSASGTIGVITKADITAITGITGVNKIYNGNTDAALNASAAVFVGEFAGDDLTLASYTGTFDNKNVGTGKTVNITGLTLGGSDAVNYNLLSTTASTTANITKLTLTDITGITAQDRVYNADVNATIDTSGAILVGKISGDDLSISSGIGTFTNKNVSASPKTVTISGLVLNGDDAINYNLPTNTPTTTATISKADISAITGITAENKTYDSFTTATLNVGTVGFTGKYAGDTLSVLTYTGTFDDKNVGTGKTVNISNLSLGSVDAVNYNLVTTTAITTANISKANITAITGITASNKTYDSTTDATLSTIGAGFTGAFAGDILAVATSSGAFTDAHAAIGKTVNISGLSITGTDAGNYTLLNSTATAFADITKASISAITGITANNKTYDSTPAATLNTVAAGFTGKFGSDDLTVATATGTFSDKNVAPGKTVSITGLSLGGTDAGNYELTNTTATTTADITKANISTITGITANNKIYDSTTDATLNTAAATFNGKYSSDDLAVATATGTFQSEHVGTGITVDITNLSLGGADAGNYNLVVNTATTTADISPLGLSAITGITGITANNKTYDGNTNAALDISGASFTGMILGDNLTVATYTGNFNNKNVGVAKPVSITGLSLGGTDAGNYTLLNTTAETTANITKLDISAITGITANSKTYDTYTTAALNLGSAVFAEKVSGDFLSVATATGTFNNKNVGVAKPVSITGLSLGGTDAGNYNLVSNIASTTANITRADINAITGISASSKVYDGTRDATLNVTAAGFTGILGTDVLSVNTSAGQFDTKNVGVGKTVSITGLTLGGTDAGNYTLLINTATTFADITKANISAITGITANDKTYDTLTNATLNTGPVLVSFTGMISGDTLTVASSTGTFDGPHAAAGKTVTITNLSLGGTDAGNYTLLNTNATTTATINKATISAVTGITANDKTYDGNTDATLNVGTVGFTGAYAGDDLTVATSTGTFDDKNAGSGKIVFITNLTLSGSDAVNYSLTDNTAQTNATISKLTLTDITGITAVDRVYNANTNATLDTTGPTFVGKISGDKLSITSATGVFDNKKVGSNKTVNISAVVLGDDDAGNYNLPINPLTTTASISKADITAINGITADNKTYDGNTDAILNSGPLLAVFTGMIGGDTLTVATATGAFTDKNAANGKTVNITGLTLGGTDASNYNLLDSTATATADINKADISAITGITADSKTYDGNPSASLDFGVAAFTGIIGSDVLTVDTSSAEFTDKNAANGKTVNISGLSLGGTDAGNYNLLDTTATTTADITKADISAITGITADDKTYDGNTDAVLNVDTPPVGFTGMIGGDSLTVASATGTFDTPIIGNGKTVNITNLSLGGTDAGNYNLVDTTAIAYADITAGDSLTDPRLFLEKNNTVPTFPVFSPALTLNGQSKISYNGLNFLLPPVEIIIGEIVAGAPPWAYLPIGLESEEPIVKKRSKNGSDYIETDKKDGDSIIRSGEGATNIIVVGDGVRLELKSSSQR